MIRSRQQAMSENANTLLRFADYQPTNRTIPRALDWQVKQVYAFGEQLRKHLPYVHRPHIPNVIAESCALFQLLPPELQFKSNKKYWAHYHPKTRHISLPYTGQLQVRESRLISRANPGHKHLKASALADEKIHKGISWSHNLETVLHETAHFIAHELCCRLWPEESTQAYRGWAAHGKEFMAVHNTLLVYWRKYWLSVDVELCPYWPFERLRELCNYMYGIDVGKLETICELEEPLKLTRHL